MVLVNETQRMRVYTLPHSEACGGECLCVSKQHLESVLNPRTGEKGVREVSLSVPRSIHIPGYGESPELPESAKNCRKIAADIKSGLLSVKED